ncbi:hypothetical protein [Natrinema sp. SYSU A 869]|uniref:hypothetical protein n=1 Tax=Natrinema sp. SYSU A 869 TaxID=2871694 RepID=UPI001CA45F78|nr:hypothetical protein [Natrinema sp. SYSU A 869]
MLTDGSEGGAPVDGVDIEFVAEPAVGSADGPDPRNGGFHVSLACSRCVRDESLVLAVASVGRECDRPSPFRSPRAGSCMWLEETDDGLVAGLDATTPTVAFGFGRPERSVECDGPGLEDSDGVVRSVRLGDDR